MQSSNPDPTVSPMPSVAAPSATTQRSAPAHLKVAVIGCGLIGGSFALGLKAAGVVGTIVGFSPSAATLEKALQMQAIDTKAKSAAECAKGADVVLLAVPVANMGEVFEAIAPTLASHTLLMDAGSTKQDVIAAARMHLQDKIACFVPAHPIAGKEKAGIAHSEEGLYCGKRVILTPLPENSSQRLAQAKSVWKALGSEVVCMPPLLHDQTFAAVSHLPHLLAFALMHSVASQAQGKDFLALAGSGFRDSTRIAASPPWVWRDILHANQEQVRLQLASLREQLDLFEAVLDKPLALNALIEKAQQVRSDMRFDTPHQQDEISS